MSYNNQYQSNPYHQAPAQESGYGYGSAQVGCFPFIAMLTWIFHHKQTSTYTLLRI